MGWRSRPKITLESLAIAQPQFTDSGFADFAVCPPLAIDLILQPLSKISANSLSRGSLPTPN
jgi:hypothetical protein